MHYQSVAVYGSLKRGYYNHHFLQGARYQGRFITLRGYALLNLGAYPGMVARGRSRVKV